MKKGKKIFIFLIVVEIGFLSGWWLKAKWDISKMDRKVEKTREEIQKIEKENERLQNMKRKIDDPFFMEKLAREKLGLAKKGEVVYKIVPGGN